MGDDGGDGEKGAQVARESMESQGPSSFWLEQNERHQKRLGVGRYFEKKNLSSNMVCRSRVPMSHPNGHGERVVGHRDLACKTDK